MINTFRTLINGANSILKGFSITIHEFFRKPVTLQYPWEKDELPSRYRGRLQIKGFFDKETIENKSQYYKDIDLAPCMKTCPAYTDVRGYITAVAENRFIDGIRILKDTYPIPGCLGRVCPAPCEGLCTREYVMNKPLTIRYLKRFLSDYERKLSPDKRVPFITNTVKTGHKIAVIGAGPAGLTCAWDLRRKGYEVTIFEKLGVAGGYLATGIPAYRLPRDILNDEIKAILDLGVDLKLNTCLGRDVHIDDLFKQGYNAVFIGVGAINPMKLGCEGEDTEGVIAGEDFLMQVNLNQPHKLQKKVAVIGGGNTAIDCARVAKRLGSEVSILYRRTQAEMPADHHEISDCLAEGVNLELLTAPLKVLGNERLTGIECIRCKLGEPDSSGRRKPIPIECSEFVFECDTVISAISRTPDLTGLPEEIKRTKWGTLDVNPLTGATSSEGIYAGGDAILGAATVIEAIASAKKAANAIDKFLSKK